MIQDMLDLIKSNIGIEIRGFNKVNRCVLAAWSMKINRILKQMRTENNTDTSIMIKAAVVFVGKKIDLNACGSKNKKELETWWKRGIEQAITYVRKHINILDRMSPERRDKEERKNVRSLKGRIS